MDRRTHGHGKQRGPAVLRGAGGDHQEGGPAADLLHDRARGVLAGKRQSRDLHALAAGELLRLLTVRPTNCDVDGSAALSTGRAAPVC